jgi:hypothetical protein
MSVLTEGLSSRVKKKKNKLPASFQILIAPLQISLG